LSRDLGLLFYADARVHLSLHSITSGWNELCVILLDSLNRVGQHLSDLKHSDATSQHVARERVTEAVRGAIAEPGEGQKLKPHQVFDYLAKKNVFRVGWKFTCPNCELEFWTPVDDLATEITCDYCGQRFSATPQLKDGAWAFRRSGLFGREDHQQGAIPVALTLQQLDTVLTGETVFVTSMTVASITGSFPQCETDLVVVSEKGFYDDRLGIAIGECKGHGEITEQDVQNLVRVADAFPKDRIAAFIIFSKTAPFTPDEIARCRAAQPAGRRRVILLSDRELEPYFVYERAAEEFVIDSTAISLEDLANTTYALYFDPKPKAQQ